MRDEADDERGQRDAVEAAFDVSPVGMSVFRAVRDAAGTVADLVLVRMNRTGGTPDGRVPAPGTRLLDYFPEATTTGLWDALVATVTSGRQQTLLVHADSAAGWRGVFENVLVPLGQDRVLCAFRDVTSARSEEQQLLHAATHDALTGLPNRALLQDRLEHALARARRHDEAFTVAFLDLDGFKAVNDTFGHLVGDGLLRVVGQRLGDVVRGEDCVARIGGDEFMLLLEGCGDEVEWRVVDARLRDALARPVRVDGRTLHVRCSIGVVTSAGEEDVPTLLRDVDMALHAAKRQGRGGYAMLSEPHRQQILQDHALELDLPHAVAAEQFVLHYQPIVATATGEVLGHEALVRWQHPERGLLAPGAFLPAVQAGGLMVELGAWVLRTAVRAAARDFGGAAGRDDAAVSVNVSAQQLVRGDLVATVREALAETGLPPARLLLELTESELLPGTVDVAGVLAELRGLGVRLAVDDFGTGWSNLAHLARLPLDVVKVDRSFLLALPDERRRDVLAATVAMTSALGARCLIEGVETPEHLALARAVGSDYAQGYLLGRPVPLPDEA